MALYLSWARLAYQSKKRAKCHDQVNKMNKINKMAYSLVLEVGLHLDVGEQLEQDMTSICYDILGL